jgi:hypothetical protein
MNIDRNHGRYERPLTKDKIYIYIHVYIYFLYHT